MAWLFPRRAGALGADRLDAVLAEQALAGEALSQAATDATAEAEDAVGRAHMLAAQSDTRIRRQEARRAERQRRAAQDPTYGIVAGMLSRFGTVSDDADRREPDA